MLRVMLIDDEILSLEQLSYALADEQDIQIVGSYVDPLEAIECIKEIRPEVLFVDVSMPMVNGFQLVEAVIAPDYQPYVVFVTGYSQYAINAFELEAVDYIPKPIIRNRIEQALGRIRKRVMGVLLPRGAVALVPNPKADDICLNCFPVEDYGAIILLNIDDIYYCSVEQKTTKVYTNKKAYVTSSALSKIEENYRAKPFFRCHKSFIVNLNHVEKILPMFNQNHIIKLRDLPIEIPVSRHYIKRLKSILKLDNPR